VASEFIGSYSIVRRICHTASSELFLANDPHNHEDVVLKVLLESQVHEKRLLRQYAREAELCEEFEHPSLVKVYRFVSDAPRPYLVMRFIPGQTLKSAIYREAELTCRRGFHWLVRAAQGLGCMHNHGYVHLDVKPENILVTEKGLATVIDLALARPFGKPGLLDSLKSRLSGEAQGTRSYMSPEQISNRPLGPTADIYSLGIITFEMFARRLPLTAADPNAILQLHLKAKPPMLHHVVPEIHPELSNLVARMLEKAPEARPQSMDTVIETLARIGKPMLKDRESGPAANG
jgi:serine/threonine protein kinase